MIVFMLLLNFVISWFNCWSCGRIWNESKALGGWLRLVVWCGAIQSVIGFSSVLGFLAGYFLHVAGYLPPQAAKAALSLWYLLIIVPALSTGLIITIESWRAAFRERDLLSMGSAAYNTFAMAHNAYQAVDGIGSALSEVGGFFSSAMDDEDGIGPMVMLLVIALAVGAIFAGAVLTAVLIKKYAGTLPLPGRVAA